jgi:hypothetical protein
MASNNYSSGLLKIQQQDIDFVNDDIRAIVVSSGFTFNKGHQFVSEISGEVSGTGYSRLVLAGKSISLVVGTPDEIQFRADDLEYTAINVSPDDLESVVIYKHVTNDADSLLIANVDFPNISTNGNNITIEFGGGVVFKAINPIV